VVAPSMSSRSLRSTSWNIAFVRKSH
jgi:hypothetical protein